MELRHLRAHVARADFTGRQRRARPESSVLLAAQCVCLTAAWSRRASCEESRVGGRLVSDDEPAHKNNLRLPGSRSYSWPMRQSSRSLLLRRWATWVIPMSQMGVAIIQELPPEELRFHWKSGRLCLDFVATVGERWRRSFERLLEADDLARWMVGTGMLREPPRVSGRQLAAGRVLREAINRLARPGAEPKRGDLEELNRWASRTPLAPQLTTGNERVWVAARPVEAMMATIARDAVELLSGPLAERVRECAAPECALLFLDASRPGRRQWCSSSVCGNRIRTKAYRGRQKERGRG